ncbi:MAG: hypothetical protein ACRBG0_21715 [Lewinella sp.]|jgi:hypothetical protein|uniref:hypothetical protein n=1 Tax=Lewinella sp. TaxID=2004506 RepID=UPI003D6C6715
MSADFAILDKDIRTAYLYKLAIETLAAKKGIVNWLSPEEAAIVLGIPINGKLRLKLSFLIQEGHIQRFTRNGNETYYWWPDLEKLAPEMSEGEVVVPTNFSRS